MRETGGGPRPRAAEPGRAAGTALARWSGESAPRPDDAPWTVAVEGLVAEPLVLSLYALRGLGWKERTVDIHCVTRWSKLTSASPARGRWPGCSTGRGRCRRRGSSPSRARSARGHSTSLPLEAVRALDPLIALRACRRAAGRGAWRASAHGRAGAVVSTSRSSGWRRSSCWRRTASASGEAESGYPQRRRPLGGAALRRPQPGQPAG